MRQRVEEELVIDLPCSIPPDRMAQLAEVIANIYVQRHIGKLDEKNYPAVVD